MNATTLGFGLTFADLSTRGEDVAKGIETALTGLGAWLLSEPQTIAALNRRIRLTEKETAVLKFLYRCAGKPVGRQTLLREVWGYASGASTHTVETHIYRLRRKIEPDPTSARILVNEDGGYQLMPERRAAPALPIRRPALGIGHAVMAGV